MKKIYFLFLLFLLLNQKIFSQHYYPLLDSAINHWRFTENYLPVRVAQPTAIFNCDYNSYPPKELSTIGDTILNANGFMLLWADEDGKQGKNHTNFKLSGTGEQLAITEYNGIEYRIIDSLRFGAQTDNVSIGCYPDATLPIVNQPTSTPGFSNLFSAVLHRLCAVHRPP